MKRTDIRYRLTSDKGQWVIERGAYRPNKENFKWSSVSFHPTLARAFTYALEHVVREGYTTTIGLEAVLQKIDEATAKVKEWGKALEKNVKAEMVIKE